MKPVKEELKTLDRDLDVKITKAKKQLNAQLRKLRDPKNPKGIAKRMSKAINAKLGASAKKAVESGIYKTDAMMSSDRLNNELYEESVKEDPFFTLPTCPEDPWKCRSARMTCVTCMWFVEKQSHLSTVIVGRCRRHAPAMNGYPVVFCTDWCGDHKVDEAKV